MKKISKNRPEKKVVIKLDGDVKRISTLDLIKIAWLNRIEKSKKGKKSAISAHGLKPDLDRMQDISSLAIVVDGEVVDVMRAQPKLTSILLAGPTFIKFNPETTRVRLGDKYESGEFIAQVSEQALQPQNFELKKEDNAD